jgi:hypothetical protein
LMIKIYRVERKPPYEVGENICSIWTWNEGETNDQKCTSNGYLHTIKEKQHFVTMFEHLDVFQRFSHSTIYRMFVYGMYYSRLLIWI